MRTPYLLAITGLLLGPLLSACAEQAPIAGPDASPYSKDGATQDDFMEDRRTCLVLAEQHKTTSADNAYGGEASSQVVVKCDALSACLASRGYQQDPKGNLAPSAEMTVQCY